MLIFIKKGLLNEENIIFAIILLVFSLVKTNAEPELWQVAMIAVLLYRTLLFGIRNVSSELEKDRKEINERILSRRGGKNEIKAGNRP